MRGEDLNNLSFVEPLLATAGPWVQDYPESSGFLVSTRSGERKAKVTFVDKFTNGYFFFDFGRHYTVHQYELSVA